MATGLTLDLDSQSMLPHWVALRHVTQTNRALELAFRRLGVEGEDAFYAAAYTYADQYRAHDLLKERPIVTRGQRIHQRLSLDDAAATLLAQLVEKDPRGADLPILYQHFIGRTYREGSGKFFTPRPIAAAMASLVSVEGGSVIMDPTCGGGTFLLEASALMAESSCTLVGNDVEPSLVDLTAVLLLLNSPAGHVTHVMSTNLYDPNPDVRSWYGKCDAILANPPFSLPVRQPGFQSPLHGLGYETSDALFLDVSWLLLRPGGRLVCLLPHSIVANKEYVRLRHDIERRWELRSVIGLPEGVFYVTAKASSRADIVVLDKRDGPIRDQGAVFSVTKSVGVPLSGRRAISTEDNELGRLASSDQVVATLGSNQRAVPTTSQSLPELAVVRPRDRQAAAWDPHRYLHRHKRGTRLGEFLSIEKPSHRSSGSPFGPIEYRSLLPGPNLAFRLTRTPQVTRLPTVGPQELLLGTMRAYLGNVLVTPLPEWLGEATRARFALKSEFVHLRPIDGNVYFWWVLLRSRSVLDRLPLGSGGTRPRLQPYDLLDLRVTVLPPRLRRVSHDRLRRLAEREWRDLSARAIELDAIEALWQDGSDDAKVTSRGDEDTGSPRGWPEDYS